MKLAKQLLNICIKKNVTISTAESCTGGALSALLTSEPGASKIFTHGFVVYSNLAKIQILSVSEKTLKQYGAVSEQVAQEMAYNCRKISGSKIGISITGIAGPGSSDSKPEGRVCFGLSTKNLLTTETIDFKAIGRIKVRERSVDHCIKVLFTQLLSEV